MHIFCDFDGTISACDTTDLVLSMCAAPSWEAVEADWVAGKIDAVACMAAQIALIDAPLEAIDAALDQVSLRDGFAEFLAWAQRRHVAITIVSDGVDYFIERVLARHGIHGLPVIANQLISIDDRRWALQRPWQGTDCAGGSGVCKCRILDSFEGSRPTVFVGDGRSDFCVAAKPDILFATAGLEQFCLTQSLTHHAFSNFGDVQSALEKIAAPSFFIA